MTQVDPYRELTEDDLYFIVTYDILTNRLVATCKRLFIENEILKEKCSGMDYNNRGKAREEKGDFMGKATLYERIEQKTLNKLPVIPNENMTDKEVCQFIDFMREKATAEIEKELQDEIVTLRGLLGKSYKEMRRTDNRTMERGLIIKDINGYIRDKIGKTRKGHWTLDEIEAKRKLLFFDIEKD